MLSFFLHSREVVMPYVCLSEVCLYPTAPLDRMHFCAIYKKGVFNGAIINVFLVQVPIKEAL
jgi:hypothetical protein